MVTSGSDSFRIDGTLVDSTGAVLRTWETWARKRDIAQERIHAVCHGRRTEDTVAEFLPVDQRESAIAELEELERSDLDDVIALPGAAELLSTLPFCRWAAVTSGSRALMRARLAAAGLPEPRVLVAAEDVSAGKPDPAGYLLAARELGHDIARCLVVEDAPAGIQAGNRSGARTLAVATSHDRRELTGSEYVAADLASCDVRCSSSGLDVWIAHMP